MRGFTAEMLDWLGRDLRSRGSKKIKKRRLASIRISVTEAGACWAASCPNRGAKAEARLYSAASIRFLRFAPTSRASTGAKNCPV
jgi:hypothetical protein